MKKKTALLAILLMGIITTANASGVMSEEERKSVDRVAIVDQEKLSKAAGLLSEYEIGVKKLIASLSDSDISATQLSQKADQLLTLSESVIESAQSRLPQCNLYLNETLKLKNQLNTISNETLEKDYHHDGALPEAPAECYHTKDLFVHPATVIVLTRDDPALKQETKDSISMEMTEVLGHIEIVREIVMY